MPPYFEKMISSPGLEIHLDVLAVLVPRAGADGENATALRLLLGGVRQDDAARGRLLLVQGLDDQPVAQWLKIHPALLLANDCFVAGTRHFGVPGPS